MAKKRPSETGLGGENEPSVVRDAEKRRRESAATKAFKLYKKTKSNEYKDKLRQYRLDCEKNVYSLDSIKLKIRLLKNKIAEPDVAASIISLYRQGLPPSEIQNRLNITKGAMYGHCDRIKSVPQLCYLLPPSNVSGLRTAGPIRVGADSPKSKAFTKFVPDPNMTPQEIKEALDKHYTLRRIELEKSRRNKRRS